MHVENMVNFVGIARDRHTLGLEDGRDVRYARCGYRYLGVAIER